jgi:membrane-bound lytic murein transglycosylase A
MKPPPRTIPLPPWGAGMGWGVTPAVPPIDPPPLPSPTVLSPLATTSAASGRESAGFVAGIALTLTFLLAACAEQPLPGPSAAPAPTVAAPTSPSAPVTTLSALPGYGADALDQAWPAIIASCRRMQTLGDRPLGPAWAGRYADWSAFCTAAQAVAKGGERALLARELVPVQVRDGMRETGLFTGYYEPTLQGSRTRRPGYDVPLYAPPRDLRPTDDRAAIDRGALQGRAQVLAWLADPVDVFFLHVQGSGRIALDDGTVLRATYAGDNGKTYVAIGRVLVDRGAIPRDQVSMQSIRAWLAANPREAPAVLQANPRYIFFRTASAGEGGPPGAQGVPLTPGRSLAADRTLYAYGVPVWLDASYPAAAGGDRPLQRLMVIQDTGSAITGRLRGDVFWGAGDEAAAIAGRMQHQGRLWLLLPRALAARWPAAN